MDGSRFDTLVSRLAEPGSRRRVLSALGISALVASGLELTSPQVEARRRRRRKKGKKGSQLQLRERCTPGKSTCAQGLKCDSPTTRHTCSSTVEGVDTWCCVPPGGKCTECDCCGDYYCSGDGTCIPNPEG